MLDVGCWMLDFDLSLQVEGAGTVHLTGNLLPEQVKKY